MLVDIMNYIGGAKVRFTPSFYKHYNYTYEKIPPDLILILPNYSDIIIFRDRYNYNTYWVSISYSIPKRLVCCISSHTMNGSDGFFLEYIKEYNIDNIINNLELLELRYEK
jgi:hypothetical protein